MSPNKDETLPLTNAQAVASDGTATQTIRDALIDAGVDLDRARSDSAVYYPDLVPQISSVATQPKVIDAVSSIRGERADARDVLGIVLSITFVTTSLAPIL
jgi:hypothetical protein